jgi:beta-mannosidase
MLRTVHQGWSVTAVGGDVPDELAGVVLPATVPGSVHLDLLDAGLIPDPYLDENEAEVGWIGFVDWRYETVLELSASDLPADGERLDLVAEGLDTLATVEVNGHVVGRTANQHRTYRFDLRGHIHPGTNSLSITFAAAMPYVQKSWSDNGKRPHVNAHPFAELRKMACNFGWDWGADLVTAGVWRAVRLHHWKGARIASVRPLVGVADGLPTLTAHVEVERADATGPLEIEVSVAGATASVVLPPGEAATSAYLEVPGAELWWPRGYGDQPLYDVEVSLADDSSALDRWSGRIGFRTTELDTSADEHGTPFTLIVNGTPIFAKGLNWLPADSFPARVTRADYLSLLEKSLESGANLLRVWGGGIYESEDFYSICDERGLLVWQDFLLACAAYSEEEPLRAEIIAEARENVTRLSQHASLVLWNGGNENIWGFEDWGWKEPLAGRSWGNGYYEEIFPAIVDELDGTRPYSPGSPYSFTKGVHPNDPSHGSMHIWDVWNSEDYTHYASYSPRFVSEFGFQGPPTWATLTRAIHDDPLSNDSPGMLSHQKAEDGDKKLSRGLAAHLPVPTNFADWHWATSLNQARALRFGIEHFRGQSPVCSGTVVWQANDTWPATSWAAIDADGRRKPLHYAIKAAYRDRLLTFSVVGDTLQLRAVNDSGEQWVETVTVAVRSADGTVLESAAVDVRLAPRETARIDLAGELASAAGAAGALVVSADSRFGRATHFYAEDVEGLLPDARLETVIDRIPGGYTVRVVARSVLRDLAILADRAAPDAVAEEMLLTLFPGEEATIKVFTEADLSEADLTAPLVLRHANQLVTAAREAAPI